MTRVFLKEINTFLNSLTGYLVVGLFITSIGLLTWIFPETSILNYGFADMATLFSVGPFVYMFLIPAITVQTALCDNPNLRATSAIVKSDPLISSFILSTLLTALSRRSPAK